MDARVLARVALRVLGVYFIAQGIFLLPGFLNVAIQATPSDTFQTYTPLLVLAVLSQFIVGALLWVLASRVATWIVRDAEGGTPASPVTAEALQTIAYVSLGAVLLVSALPRIFGILFAATMQGNPSYVLLRGEDFFTAVGVAILGMALSFGGRYFTRFLKRIRSS